MPLHVRSVKVDDVVVVHVRGELDIATAAQLWSHLSGWIEAGEVHILIDCADVTFLDCAGITALVRGVRAVRTRGGWMQLRQVSPQVFQLLTLAGLANALLQDGEPRGARGEIVGSG